MGPLKYKALSFPFCFHGPIYLNGTPQDMRRFSCLSTSISVRAESIGFGALNKKYISARICARNSHGSSKTHIPCRSSPKPLSPQSGEGLLTRFPFNNLRLNSTHEYEDTSSLRTDKRTSKHYSRRTLPQFSLQISYLST